MLKLFQYAKLHRPNPLHIILKCDNWEAKNGFFNNARFSTANYTKSLKEIKKNEKIQAKQLKENISQYEDKLPPTWFIQYMERVRLKFST